MLMMGLSAVLVSRPRLVISIFYTSKISRSLVALRRVVSFLRRAGRKGREIVKLYPLPVWDVALLTQADFYCRTPLSPGPFKHYYPPTSAQDQHLSIEQNST